jgi:hypothetical protein
MMLESIDVGPNPSELDLKMKALMEAHEIDKARALIAATPGAETTWWAETLALPKVTSKPSTGRGDFCQNWDWVNAHREDYAGQWVALRYGELVDHDPSWEELRRRLKEAGGEGTLLVPV